MNQVGRELKQTWSFPHPWLRRLIVVLLLIGVFFRFSNLGEGVYFRDEAYTSFRISGYTQTEIVQQVFNGNVISVEALQKYQRLAPKKKLVDTIQSLAVEDAQHPPLYYVLARWWVQYFGDSVAVTRSLSAAISLLAFPCMYWLCLELFGSHLVAWVAIALVAVLPFYLIPAQLAREYGLWTVTTLFSSAALLRAIRLNTKVSWGIYAASVAVSLYTFLFSVFFLIAHGIYVTCNRNCQLKKTFKSYVIALAIGGLLFSPWALVVINNFSTINSTTSWISAEQVSWIELVKSWLINLGLTFIYSGRLGLPFIIVGGYAIYFVCRYGSKRARLFILVLIAVPSLALILPDLLLGGQRSTISRYWMPCYIGIHLAVAYLLATKITSPLVKNRQNKIWKAVLILIISAGILSGVKSFVEGGWDRGDAQNKPIAQMINQANQPLVISDAHRGKDGGVGTDGSIGAILSLSHLLNPNVKLELVVEPDIPNIPEGFNNIFLYFPSQTLLDRMNQEYNIEPVKNVEQGYLFKIKYRQN